MNKLAEGMKPGYIETNHSGEVATSKFMGLKQKLFYAPQQRKMELFIYILRKRISGQVIVFRRTTFGAEKVQKTLLKNGFNSVCIHSDIPAKDQKEALKKFEAKEVQFLVITDVSSRKIKLDKVAAVFNFDFPAKPIEYLDRQLLVGYKGISFSLCSIEEKSTLRAIEDLIDRRLLVEKNHPFNDNPEEFTANVRRPKGASKKGRKSTNSKQKKKRWY